MTDHATPLPTFVAAGEALTDMIRTGSDSWLSKVGGSTWNVARVMASLGQSSAFAGAISTDCFGQDLLQATTAAGLDLRFLQQVNKSPLLAIVHSSHPPQYFFVGDDAADLHFDRTALPQAWQQAVKWVHFGGISLARQPLAGQLLALARELKSNGVKISYDPNFRILMDEKYDATLREMTELADVIKVSDEDLLGLFRTENLDLAFKTLSSWNTEATYLYTRGAEGASLYADGTMITAAAVKIKVADTVGAGDASMGGFIYSLMNYPKRSAHEHLSFSIASGAAACMHHGATPPTLDAINTLYLSALG
ncbi:carbohydrate kinase [Chitinibacter bivalviorum]|uniref:Carbohydrate kinase n=1 Tax=Chitinibacter bivalviorum TaxID=2739434 RepID=A0A7H9BMF8_9NEIS|nr:carbohydrate kinase [Chitinibacter bivalviorum]QLG89745.1 carbohydrate kinase [Chitinibacter bivalviorum]